MCRGQGSPWLTCRSTLLFMMCRGQGSPCLTCRSTLLFVCREVREVPDWPAGQHYCSWCAERSGKSLTDLWVNTTVHDVQRSGKSLTDLWAAGQHYCSWCAEVREVPDWPVGRRSTLLFMMCRGQGSPWLTCGPQVNTTVHDVQRSGKSLTDLWAAGQHYCSWCVEVREVPDWPVGQHYCSWCAEVREVPAWPAGQHYCSWCAERSGKSLPDLWAAGQHYCGFHLQPGVKRK